MFTILDIETTGLMLPLETDINLQPSITEIYAAQLDANYNVIKEIETFVKPPRPISKLITKLTGITNKMVESAPVFFDIYHSLCSVFFGSSIMVAHNLSFDHGLIVTELTRIGKEFNFPYPPIHFCTIEQSIHLKGHRLKNGELYKIATGKEPKEAHRAKVDTLETLESYKWLRSQENGKK